MNIGLIGKPGAGKDYVGEKLQQAFGIDTLIRFADPLKQMSAYFFPPETRENKETPFHFSVEEFGKLVENSLDVLQFNRNDRDIVHRELEDTMKKAQNFTAYGVSISPRQFQQYIGAILREQFDYDFLVNFAKNKLGHAMGPDVRYMNEAKIFDLLIYINHEEPKPFDLKEAKQKNHVTEHFCLEVIDGLMKQNALTQEDPHLVEWNDLPIIVYQNNKPDIDNLVEFVQDLELKNSIDNQNKKPTLKHN